MPVSVSAPAVPGSGPAEGVPLILPEHIAAAVHRYRAQDLEAFAVDAVIHQHHWGPGSCGNPLGRPRRDTSNFSPT